MSVNFDVYNNMIILLRQNKNIDDIATILHLDRTYVVNALKHIKTQIITSLDEDKLDVVILIDRLVVKKKYKNITRDFGGVKNQIFEFLCDGISNDVIMSTLKIDYDRYLSFLKQMYFSLLTYANDGERKYIDLIKTALIEQTLVVKNTNRKNNRRNSIISVSDTMKLKGLDGSVVSTDAKFGQLGEVSMLGNSFKFIVISDTHFGSVYENMAYLDMVYQHAAKNNIRHIFHTGDLLEGAYANYRRCKREYKNLDSQLEHVINDYCYDKDITNHILLGNHDAFSIVNDGVDIEPLLACRDDFDLLGYKSAYIKIRSEYISLKHDISRLLNNPEDKIVLLNFMGHSHQYKCSHDDKYAVFRVPTLSDLPSHKLALVNRGYFEGEIDFDDDIAEYLRVTYKSFDDNSSSTFDRVLVK